MIFTGQSTISFLADQIKNEDPAASSHWKKYHEGFEFNGRDFIGLQGFGNLEKPFRRISWLAHSILQLKFRKMGANFSQFRSLDSIADKIAKAQDRSYNLDMLRQTLSLAFVKEHIPVQLSIKSTVWVIGDGFASMTSLLWSTKAAGCIIMINLTKTLMVDLWYLKLAMGKEAFENAVDLVTDEESMQKSLTKVKDDKILTRIIALQASDHHLLDHCPASLVINIASMQEMDPPVTASYFSHIYKASLKSEVAFYCCNREDKTLPNGVVSRFSEYPWNHDDIILVNELCPWHQQYYLLERPYYRPYDGPIRHRLSIIKKHD